MIVPLKWCPTQLTQTQTDGQTENDAYEPIMQNVQVGSKTRASYMSWLGVKWATWESSATWMSTMKGISFSNKFKRAVDKNMYI